MNGEKLNSKNVDETINYFLDQFNRNINVSIQYAYLPKDYSLNLSNYQSPTFLANERLTFLGTYGHSSANAPDYGKVFWEKIKPNQVVEFISVNNNENEVFSLIKNIDDHSEDGYINISGRIVFSITTYSSYDNNTLQKSTEYFDLLKNDYSETYHDDISYGSKEYIKLEDKNNYHQHMSVRFINAN